MCLYLASALATLLLACLCRSHAATIPVVLHPHGYLVTKVTIGHVPCEGMSIPAMQPREFTLQVSPCQSVPSLHCCRHVYCYRFMIQLDTGSSKTVSGLIAFLCSANIVVCGRNAVGPSRGLCVQSV
jgi:hypothetical protein